MDIVQNVPAPPEILEIARRELTETNVSVIFDIGLNLGDDWRMGEFMPDLNCILIDLEACARDYALVSRGCTYVATIWFNLLYTIFHETAHAQQLIRYPDRMKELNENAIAILDNAAHKQALERLYEWSENGSIPELTRWGWLGGRVKELLNALYATMPNEISDEVDCLGTTACAYADAVVKIYPNFHGQSIEALFEEIDRGEFGAKINGRRYLNAYEFLAVHCETD
jgi:hypothetical protein